MLLRAKIFVIMLSIGLLIVIFELVRRKKLREEYSWLWMLTGAIVFVLAVWRGLLLYVTGLIGAALPTSTIFFFGVFFLVLINLYFSVKLSTTTDRLIKVTQELALLRDKIESSPPHEQE